MLAVSTKYALKALRELAKGSREDFMQVKILSEAADVPGPYLSKIIKTLAAKGIVETKKGITGGVKLARPRKPLTFLDVCVALDDPVVMQQCILSREGCNGAKPCDMHFGWKKIKEELLAFLEQAQIEE